MHKHMSILDGEATAKGVYREANVVVRNFHYKIKANYSPSSQEIVTERWQDGSHFGLQS